MAKLFSVCVLLIVLFSSCRKNQVLTEKEVIDVINRFDEGWRIKNIKKVDSVLAPSYIYFTQSGGVFSRDGVVQTAGSDEYKLDSINRNIITVKLYENTAVVSTRWYGKGVYRGVPFDEDQRCSIIIVKSKNKTEILSEHCTPIKTTLNFH